MTTKNELVKELKDIRSRLSNILSNPKKYRGYAKYSRNFIIILNTGIFTIDHFLIAVKEIGKAREEVRIVQQQLQSFFDDISTESPRIERVVSSDRLSVLYRWISEYGYNETWIKPIMKHLITVFTAFLSDAGTKK